MMACSAEMSPTMTQIEPFFMSRKLLGSSGQPTVTKNLNMPLSDPLLECIHYHSLTRLSAT